MVTVKLIESDDYYVVQRRQFFLLFGFFFLPTSIMHVFVDGLAMKLLTTVPAVFILYFVFRLRRKSEAATQERLLSLAPHEIRVTATADGRELNRFDVAELRHVRLRVGNNSSEESLEKYKAILIDGQPPINALSFTHAGREYHYEFVVDSFYTQTQLGKLAATWSGDALPTAA